MPNIINLKIVFTILFMFTSSSLMASSVIPSGCTSNGTSTAITTTGG